MGTATSHNLENLMGYSPAAFSQILVNLIKSMPGCKAGMYPILNNARAVKTRDKPKVNQRRKDAFRKSQRTIDLLFSEGKRKYEAKIPIKKLIVPTAQTNTGKSDTKYSPW
jgi:hypothetical protein